MTPRPADLSRLAAHPRPQIILCAGVTFIDSGGLRVYHPVTVLNTPALRAVLDGESLL